jgi:hypothetical protein
MATTFTKIATTTVGSGGVSSVTFSAIPATYTDLCVKISARTDRTEVDDLLDTRPNGSTSNRTFKFIRGNGTNVTSESLTRTVINGATSTSNTFSNTEIYFPNYAGATNKSMSIDSVSENNATEAYAALVAMLWSDATAISSLVFAPTYGTVFSQYSTFTLYGINKS